MIAPTACGPPSGWYLQRDQYLPCINNPCKPQMQIKKAVTFFSVNWGFSLPEPHFDLQHLHFFPKCLYVFCYIQHNLATWLLYRVLLKPSGQSLKFPFPVRYQFRPFLQSSLTQTTGCLRWGGHRLWSHCDTAPQLPFMVSCQPAWGQPNSWENEM